MFCLLKLAVIQCFLFVAATLDCGFKFVEYLPSDFEKLWVNNVQKWDTTEENFCQIVKTYEREINLWFQQLSLLPGSVLSDIPHEIFSRFRYERNCSHENSTQHVFSYIEPLAVFLRDPKALCLGGGVLGRSHYKMASDRDPVGVQANATGRVFLFDLGASTWNKGAGGSSQDYFWKLYRDAGLQISRMFLWEANKREPKAIFSAVPGEAFHSYQYFNIPAVPDQGDPKNPFEIMRLLGQKEDFIVIKLDIDNGPVENRFIEQLLHDEELLSLVDEMFFEHHVNFGPMRRYWKKQVDKSKKTF